MLVCSRCGSGSIITDREFVSGQGWIDRPRCIKCGREKFEEVENTDIGIPISVEPENTDTSPLQTGEKIRQEARMVTAKDLREAGITKEQYKAHKLWKTESLKSVAARVKVKGDSGASLPNRPAPPPPPPKPAPLRVEVKQAEPEASISLISLFLYPELLEKLTQAAKKEWRTPEGQAAYLIEKALQG